MGTSKAGRSVLSQCSPPLSSPLPKVVGRVAGTVKALACELQERLIPAHSSTKKKFFNAGLSAGSMVCRTSSSSRTAYIHAPQSESLVPPSFQRAYAMLVQRLIAALPPLPDGTQAAMVSCERSVSDVGLLLL